MTVYRPCPEHGEQEVTGISGDLGTVFLACGAVVTSDGRDLFFDHPLSGK